MDRFRLDNTTGYNLLELRDLNGVFLYRTLGLDLVEDADEIARISERIETEFKSR